MIRKTGFTLIELLVVIAIIAILAAIIFPVYARTKDSAYRGADMSNMNQIRSALQLYRADQGAYPPALLGYATGYSNFTPSDSDIVPADKLAGTLYPKRVDSLETLRPAYNRPSGTNFNSQFTTAYWPGTAGSQPYQQRYGFGDGPNSGAVSRCVDTSLVPNYYYRVSGYDVAQVPAGAPNAHSELRYTLFWSGYTVPSTCNPPDVSGSPNDNPRQLGYTDPPDTTVITWDSYFRDYDAGVLQGGEKRDIVLFLGGSARPFDSAAVARDNWQVTP